MTTATTAADTETLRLRREIAEYDRTREQRAIEETRTTRRIWMSLILGTMLFLSVVAVALLQYAAAREGSHYTAGRCVSQVERTTDTAFTLVIDCGR